MIKNAPATFVLIGLNLIAFAWLAIQQQSLMMNTSLDMLAILHAGGNLNPFTLGGEPWRVLTSMFLHFGILHFAVNMYGLFSLGVTLEPAVGTLRFVLVYLLCGIVAGIASLVFNFNIISAGASGAIFGIYGYRLGAELIGNFHDRSALGRVITNFVIFLLINAYLTVQFNVDLAAHIGGCIAGLILSVVQFRFSVLVSNLQLAVATLLVSSIIFFLPRGVAQYYDIFQRVLTTERRTSQFYKYVNSDAELADSLRIILPMWDSIQNSVNRLPGVPNELVQDTSTLKKYAYLRRVDAAYRISLVERESYVYMDSLEIVNARLDSLPHFQYNFNYNIPEDAEILKDTTRKATPSVEAKRVFYNADWRETDDPSASAYYRVGTVDSLGRWQGQVRDYYRNGNIQMKGKYTDDLKDGIFIYYSEQGTYSSAGKFVKEESVGKWEEYHWNGVLQSETRYDGGVFTMNTWDSLGNPQVVNGRGRVVTYYANGQIREEGMYRDGRREGDWLGFHENGRPYYKEYYNDNRLIRGASEDQQGKRYVYDQLSLYPFPEAGMAEFKRYVDANMRRPVNSSFVSGSVKVIFDVGTDGAMWDFVILKSLSPEHDAEAIRLVREGPAWRPGLLHGHQRFHSQGYVQIDF